MTSIKTTGVPTPTKEELLDWMLTNHITVRFDSPMTWTRQDNGGVFVTCWSVQSAIVQFATYDTVEETLYRAYESWHSHPAYRSI